MRLLNDEEISRAAYERNHLFGENDSFAYTRKSEADRTIAKAQHQLDLEQFMVLLEAYPVKSHLMLILKQSAEGQIVDKRI